MITENSSNINHCIVKDWINVDYNPPPINKNVLTYDDMFRIFIAKRLPDNTYKVFDSNSIITGVKFYMDLPNPPKVFL